MKEWSETLTLLGTLLSTGIGLEIIRWIITRWSARGDAERVEREALRHQQHEDQRTYYDQLRDDYRQLREEYRLLHITLSTIEKAHRECEEVLLKAERDGNAQRQQLQLLQLQYDELTQDVQELTKKKI